MTVDGAPHSQLPAAPEQGGGILSKVVKFVSNPTKDWKDLASRLSASQQSSVVHDDVNAQLLRERIERKRRNDFIRKAEFAQLRKTINARKKQRQLTLPATVMAKLANVQSSESHSQSVLSQSRSRTGTLEKINEIEAQLSKQWWQASPSDRSTPEGQIGKDGSALQQDGEPDFFSEAQSLFFADAVAANVRKARKQMASGQAQASPLNEWIGKLRHIDEALEFFGFQEEFVHQADLEEAAILFASHRIAEAEKGLVDVIRKHMDDSEQDQIELWMTLFDLYRAIGAHERFDAVAMDYAKRFDRSAPIWISLPEQLGLAQQDKEQKRPFSWISPPDITLQTVATLAVLQDRSASPYQLNWGRLSSIQFDAVKPLTDFLHHLATLPGTLKFELSDKLSELLQSKTPVSDASVDVRWWLLRLAVLRVMNEADQFEMVALDYTITYEESPPMFQAPIIHYSATGEDGAPRTNGKDKLAEAKSVLHTAVLQGRIENDATDLLEQSAAAIPDNAPLAIDCCKLISIDFSAAGSVLNWAALQQSKGRVVVFNNLHRLIAIFFNVLGINEHARVVPRKN